MYTCLTKFKLNKFINFIDVNSEKADVENDEMTSKMEYVNVFNNMPAVLGYVVDMLRKKPEVLERNDIDVFEKDNKQGS